MGTYRLFSLDAAKRITHRQDFDAVDDLAAISFAQTHFSETECELWELGRKVAIVSANGRVRYLEAILKTA